MAPRAGLPLAAGCAAAPGTGGAAFRRYRADLHLAGIPPALDAYLATVVTPTLEAQKACRCLVVKFEAAYLRSLD